jgi:hypothetical protein
MATNQQIEKFGLDLSDDMILVLGDMERTNGAIDVSIKRFLAEIAKLEMELTENPTYRKILKLRGKIAMLKNKKRENVAAIDKFYEAGTKKARGSRSMADMFESAIPDAPSKQKALPRGRK